MRINKKEFYQGELQVVNECRFKVRLEQLGDLPTANYQVFLCQSCKFPLLQQHCTYCHFVHEDMTFPEVMQQPIRNFKTSYKNDWLCLRNAPLKDSRRCYILLVDISGSIGNSYRAPEGFRTPTIEKIINFLGYEAYKKLNMFIPQQDILKYMSQFKSCYEFGMTHTDIIEDYRKQHGRHYGGMTGVRNSEVHITKKEIIQMGVKHFLQSLALQNPDAIVYIVYFNNNIMVPGLNFKGYQTIGNLDDAYPDLMFQRGQQYVDFFKPKSIRDEHLNIFQNFSSVTPDGQTALGPALLFCFGMANRIQMPIHQINIITDGCSNVSFGATEYEEPGLNTKELYRNWALNYAIPNSCMVNIIGFSDVKIGIDKINDLISLTNGISFLIDVKQTHNESSIDQQAFNKYLKQFQLYIDRLGNCTYDTRICVIINDANIRLSVQPQQSCFVRPTTYDNCLEMCACAFSKNKQLTIYFQSKQPSEEKVFKITIVSDFYFQNNRHLFLNEQEIRVIKGSQEECDRAMLSQLSNELKELKLKQRPKQQELQSIRYRMERYPKILVEDKMHELSGLSKELECMKLEEDELRKKKGQDYMSVRGRRIQEGLQ